MQLQHRTQNRCTNEDLSLLVDMETPDGVFKEVREIVAAMHPGFDFGSLKAVFDDIVKLYGGLYPGYRKCNTGYHNLKHTTDVFLALARLIHGYSIEGDVLGAENTRLVLISALMHDTGYIQTDDDVHGTGGKYTAVHVQRSIDFMRKYFERRGFAPRDFLKCERFVNSTNLSVDIGGMSFESAEEELAGRLLFIADILGQMADRLYLEKLLFLYDEFKEASIMGFSDEGDLLEKTLDFYNGMMQRLHQELGYSDRYMKNHFRARWKIDGDFYLRSIGSNIMYLEYILENHRHNYMNMLNRGGRTKDGF